MPRKKVAGASKNDSSPDEDHKVIQVSGKKGASKGAPKTDNASSTPDPTQLDKPDLPTADEVKVKSLSTPMKPSSGGKINLSTVLIPFFCF